MGALRTVGLVILAVSAFTFIALFGRLPAFRWAIWQLRNSWSSALTAQGKPRSPGCIGYCGCTFQMELRLSIIACSAEGYYDAGIDLAAMYWRKTTRLSWWVSEFINTYAHRYWPCILDLLCLLAGHWRRHLCPDCVASAFEHSSTLGTRNYQLAIFPAVQVYSDQVIYHSREPCGRDETLSVWPSPFSSRTSMQHLQIPQASAQQALQLLSRLYFSTWPPLCMVDELRRG